MWTERKKQIGPSELPGPIATRQDMLKPGGIPYAGMAGAKNGREGGTPCQLSCWG